MDLDSSDVRESPEKRWKGKCSYCGAENVTLGVHHITPIAEGGDNSPENLVLLCSTCHASLHQRPEVKHYEFEAYLAQLLERSGQFRNVRREVSIGKGLDVDLLAEERVDKEWQKVAIECTPQSSLPLLRLLLVRERLLRLRSLLKRTRMIFAFPGRLSSEGRARLEKSDFEIWDLDYIAATFKNEIAYVPHPILQPLLMGTRPVTANSAEQILIQKLNKCAPGIEHCYNYQSLVGEILERLFCPPLLPPIPHKRDASKTNVRDFILPNYATEGFWAFVRSKYSADYVVVDAKNYRGKVKKDEVLQISNYLKQHGTGLFALMICRNGGNTGCTQTLREVWVIDGKLIVVLTDYDVEQMLTTKSSGGEPESIIRQKIEDFRLSL